MWPYQPIHCGIWRFGTFDVADSRNDSKPSIHGALKNAQFKSAELFHDGKSAVATAVLQHRVDVQYLGDHCGK